MQCVTCLFRCCFVEMSSNKRSQMFSIDDAFEEEHNDAIRVYGATTTTERSPLKPKTNGTTPTGGVAAADSVSVHIHDPPNPLNVRPIIRGLSKLKGGGDDVSLLKTACSYFYCCTASFPFLMCCPYL